MTYRKRIALMLLSVLFVGAVIKSGASSDNWTIGATSKAGRTTLYDDRGNSMGQKPTYTAGTTALTATAAGTTPFFSICGSATKTLRIQRFNINGSVATTAVRQAVVLRKTSAATSAGTATTLTQVPHDSNSAAGTATLVNYYTVLATAGTPVGVVGTQMKNWPITATMASTDNVPEIMFLFGYGSDETESLALRGTSQCLEASFGATTTNAPTLELAVTWTEE